LNDRRRGPETGMLIDIGVGSKRRCFLARQEQGGCRSDEVTIQRRPKGSPGDYKNNKGRYVLVNSAGHHFEPRLDFSETPVPGVV
jgi:hypothetical protein